MQSSSLNDDVVSHRHLLVALSTALQTLQTVHLKKLLLVSINVFTSGFSHITHNAVRLPAHCCAVGFMMPLSS